ncbi:hypothetical protein PtB15_12B371 [Puccinia triticina]|nr:hypothetical protein PtB15_12B371 [Puccinia triticina]
MVQEIRDLRKKQDEEAEKLGSYFSATTGAERNPNSKLSWKLRLVRLHIPPGEL